MHKVSLPDNGCLRVLLPDIALTGLRRTIIRPLPDLAVLTWGVFFCQSVGVDAYGKLVSFQ